MDQYNAKGFISILSFHAYNKPDVDIIINFLLMTLGLEKNE